MNALMKIPIITAGILIMNTSVAMAQKAAPATTPHTNENKTVWKKTVSRVVDLKRPTDTLTHLLLDHSADTTLFEYLIHNVKNGSLVAYKIDNYTYNEKLTKDDLNKILKPADDTILLTDPVTGAESMKTIADQFDISSVHKYRIVEDWTFDPSGGETNMAIKGIIPLQDVRINNDYLGVRGMFFVKYAEAQKTIEKYNQFNPTNTLSMKIWDDYFQDDVKPGVAK